MLKITFSITYTQNPIVEVSQNYDESGTSACLQSFNVIKESFQINAKNVSSNTYYARNFNWFSKGY